MSERRSARKSDGNTQRNFICPYDDCKRAFSKKWNLQAHERLHTGALPFECRLGCGQFYMWMSSRKGHEQNKCKFSRRISGQEAPSQISTNVRDRKPLPEHNSKSRRYSSARNHGDVMGPPKASSRKEPQSKRLKPQRTSQTKEFASMAALPPVQPANQQRGSASMAALPRVSRRDQSRKDTPNAQGPPSIRESASTNTSYRGFSRRKAISRESSKHQRGSSTRDHGNVSIIDRVFSSRKDVSPKKDHGHRRHHGSSSNSLVYGSLDDSHHEVSNVAGDLLSDEVVQRVVDSYLQNDSRVLEEEDIPECSHFNQLFREKLLEYGVVPYDSSSRQST
eukprot:GFKZ01004654.1.p1 GENE.GFKZ01004654.1~~GFKZ01004654.1.p1  ORF type:complete len:365 (-),score=22.26 GFKZ01004654.1:388-1395(-)